MLTVNLARRAPVDRGISVIVDLPHAADLPARPHLCSLMTADTHEPISSVIGMSMHFDLDPARGDYELWVVAEQFVDENNEPLPLGAPLAPALHAEYFRGSLRTALFRYRVAGFTTGSRFDQTSTWHRYVSDAAIADAASEARPHGLTEFEVTFSNLLKTHVTGHHFEYADGFVAFYDGDGRRTAAFRIDEVLGVRTLTEKRVLVVDDAQLRILRSALLWDEQRVANCEAASGYRTQVRDVLAQVLGMFFGEQTEANACAPAAGDGDEPNERTRQAAVRLDTLVERR